MNVQIENWGLVDYREALDRQMKAHEDIVGSLAGAPNGSLARPLAGALDGSLGRSLETAAPLLGKIVFCSHPPVVTLGRKFEPSEIQGWTGETIEIARGGKSTYHGPSQLVCYPILNLSHAAFGRQRDIGWYLRAFESSIVRLLSDYGIAGEGRAFRQGAAGGETAGSTETGVWVGGKKIASLGIGIRSWVTFHGAALNLDDDPRAFAGLRPCGFEPSIMTNLERILGHKVNAAEAANEWGRLLSDELGKA